MRQQFFVRTFNDYWLSILYFILSALVPIMRVNIL